ncbi:glycosyltransferase [Bacillus salacetis]|uniref:Glycosyltransferase n=1 Tax=Bacillus salacetis TaxID=2315464 RepID=A0A3A1RDK1_9BACI|nr:glycosyltransferase [Bacillus salacetis]RIW39035.1 glycosyltransferase [Bacillus salacetis]
MKVSIIIPFYNCPYVDQAVKSALNQTYPNIEVIVVNDGSTQHTEKLSPYLSRIKYIQKPNGGTATALNAGIDAATGDYFAWLSSDDLFLPNKTASQLAFMRNSNARLSYTGFKFMDSNGSVTSEMRYRDTTWQGMVDTLAVRCPINGCTVMADMDLIRQAGKFDESLRYTHDYDMWCKLSLLVPMKYMDLLTVQYRVHDNMGTKKHHSELLAEAEQVKNRYKQPFSLFNENGAAARRKLGSIPLRKKRKPL